MPDRRHRRTPPAAAVTAAAAVITLAIALTACSGGDEPDAAPTPTPTPTATATPTPPPAAVPARVPPDDACYDLSFRQAVSPTNGEDAVACRRAHTSQTYEVGQVDNVVGGHLLAIDSARVQSEVATTCPSTLGDLVGGSLEDQRLSMLRSVWFTPSLEQADKGAAWYRCDVVALAGAEDLVEVTGSLDGILDTTEGRDRFGMCGTASPSARGFERVPCSADHSWRAFSVIALDEGDYPGAAQVDTRGNECEDAAAGVVDDPLDYEWAYEGPDRAEWRTGQTFIRCWAQV